MITLTNITFENDKVTLTLEDFLKLIKQDKLTEVECKFEPKPMAPATAFLQVEPKPMAFDTKQELEYYVKNNPDATCEGISAEELVRFINGNKYKCLFLKKANLSGAKLSGAKLIGADLSGADLSGAKLIGANLSGAKLIGAKLSGADLSGADLSGADLSGAKLSGETIFPAGFIMSQKMIKL